MRIRRRREWLYEEDFFPPYRFLKLDRSLSVREAFDRTGAWNHSQIRRDCNRQFRIRCSCKDGEWMRHVQGLPDMHDAAPRLCAARDADPSFRGRCDDGMMAPGIDRPLHTRPIKRQPNEQ